MSSTCFVLRGQGESLIPSQVKEIHFLWVSFTLFGRDSNGIASGNPRPCPATMGAGFAWQKYFSFAAKVESLIPNSWEPSWLKAKVEPPSPHYVNQAGRRSVESLIP
jgi:hypothetical protein